MDTISDFDPLTLTIEDDGSVTFLLIEEEVADLFDELESSGPPFSRCIRYSVSFETLLDQFVDGIRNHDGSYSEPEVRPLIDVLEAAVARLRALTLPR